MILFLDFDGVLHPSEVYLVRGRSRLSGSGELFMWSSIIADAIADRPDVRLVLSTNWVRHRGFTRARDALPERLRERVIGSTFHSALLDWYDATTRYQQIAGYLSRSRIAEEWLAIDDLHEGDEIADWPANDRHRLVLTNPDHGISDPASMASLRQALGVL